MDLFRSRPTLAAELIQSAYRVVLPEVVGVEIVSASFAEVRPPEYAADLVLQAGDGKHRFVVVVEVQLDASGSGRDAKRRVWPRSWAGRRSR